MEHNKNEISQDVFSPSFATPASVLVLHLSASIRLINYTFYLSLLLAIAAGNKSSPLPP